MRRFESKDRFWEIAIDGTSVRTRSGKIGSDGKLNAPKKLKSAGLAVQDVEKRCAEQREKGRSIVKVFVNQTGMWRLIRSDTRYWEKYWEDPEMTGREQVSQ
jgi:predicted DNA-binding WGR domain protein